MARPALVSFLAEATAACKGQNLESMLIKPIQRLTKYPLFFKDLLKSVQGAAVDKLEKAAALVREVSHGVDAAMATDEAQLLELIKELGPEWLVLLAPHRRITHEFNCRIVSAAGSCEGHGFLIADLLLLCKRSSSGASKWRPRVLFRVRELLLGDKALEGSDWTVPAASLPHMTTMAKNVAGFGLHLTDDNRIASIDPNGAAAQDGTFSVGDWLLAVNEVALGPGRTAADEVARAAPGQPIKFSIQRFSESQQAMGGMISPPISEWSMFVRPDSLNGSDRQARIELASAAELAALEAAIEAQRQELHRRSATARERAASEDYTTDLAVDALAAALAERVLDSRVFSHSIDSPPQQQGSRKSSWQLQRIGSRKKAEVGGSQRQPNSKLLPGR